MHELSVTENILNITLRNAQNADAKSVVRIYLVIGQLSSIVDDSIKFYWEMIAKDTIAQNAELQFKRIQTRFKCMDCSQEYEPSGDNLSCPNCKSTHIKVLNGEEFYIEAIDIDK
jgi:hydrogenase nickel incorporation protein HypA/HybF